MNYDLWGYLNTGGLLVPSIKKEVSTNSVFRVLCNLVWHCNEQDQNKVWVGVAKQAIETKMGRSTILLARKALQQNCWLIDTGEKESYGAWVYRLDIPGYESWRGLNSQTDYKTRVGLNSQTDLRNPGLSNGSGNGLSNGLPNGLPTGLGIGLPNGLNSQPQTELNTNKENTNDPNDPLVVEARNRAMQQAQQMLIKSYKSKDEEKF